MKLRWYQYSLRSLMIVVTLACIAMSWVAAKMKQARERKAAVERILNDGGRVIYDYQRDAFDNVSEPPGPLWLRELLGNDLFANVTEVDFEGGPCDANLENLKGFTSLRSLRLNSTMVSDANMENLRRLTSIRSLKLGPTILRGFNLEDLKGLPHLEELDLSNAGSWGRDIGLRHLEGLTGLRKLNLYGACIGDEDQKHLGGLVQLQELDLSYTSVTDAGLKHLKGLTQLRRLLLHFSNVTAAGAAELQKALPNCQISR